MGITGGCFHHPERVTGVRCTRCGRFICNDCMIQAPVGHHCPTCVKEAQGDLRHVRQVRYSGPPRVGPAAAVTLALLAVNAVVFVLQQVVPDLSGRLADNPTLVSDGEYYRLLTSTFLHANVFHLGMNMLGLWFIGPELEIALGRARFLALYLVSGVAGSVCFNLFGSPEAFSVGASGAVVGLLAAFLLVARDSGYDAGRVGLLLAVNVFSGLAIPQIDFYGHLGGAVGGAALMTGFLLARSLRGTAQKAAQVAAVAVVLAPMALVLGDATEAPPPANREDNLALPLSVMDRQVEIMTRAGVSYDVFLRQPPGLDPTYQSTENGSVRLAVLALKHPQRERAVRVDWGDGATEVVTVPPGRNAFGRRLSHTFSPNVARYEVAATWADPTEEEEGLAPYTATIDVCPGGATVPVPTMAADVYEEDVEFPVCGVPSGED